MRIFLGIAWVLLIAGCGYGVWAATTERVKWDELLAMVGGVGSFCSAVGVLIAIWQIVLAKEKASEAEQQAKLAETAATKARDAVDSIRIRMKDDLCAYLGEQSSRHFKQAADHRRYGRWIECSSKLEETAVTLGDLANMARDDADSVNQLSREIQTLADKVAELEGDRSQRQNFPNAEFRRCSAQFWEVVRPYKTPVSEVVINADESETGA